jgi:hypothetical protein
MIIYKIFSYENMLMKGELCGVSVLASETGLFYRNFAEQVLVSDCGAMLKQ